MTDRCSVCAKFPFGTDVKEPTLCDGCALLKKYFYNRHPNEKTDLSCFEKYACNNGFSLKIESGDYCVVTIPLCKMFSKEDFNEHDILKPDSAIGKCFFTPRQMQLSSDTFMIVNQCRVSLFETCRNRAFDN
jgi:hypothetical protein